jgi:hypothetical protein
MEGQSILTLNSTSSEIFVAEKIIELKFVTLEN